ncbi:MAG: hypothetical protein HY431_00945 [Candidatus Levybacteria bacterium]|nr:hypothetical protein [Candidatus Levybacteria bacterium]
MVSFSLRTLSLSVSMSAERLKRIVGFFEKHATLFLIVVLSAISVFAFLYYLDSGLGLAYNDARSHLDIGRRVVEGLKPGLAQIGSVWLPLPHLLMVPTIWSDFMWHTGLAGAIQSMLSFLGTGILIYLFLKKLGVGLLGRLIGVFVFVANINILYLQSTAMTELLLLATMTAAAYELMVWHKDEKLLNLIKASAWVMLSTLIRYDGWFLLFVATLLVMVHTLRRRNFRMTEGATLVFLTLSAFGIVLWLLWNLLIFKDPFYFAFGPFSAHAQQEQLDQAGVLATKNDIILSTKVYLYALAYNSYAFSLVLGLIGLIVFLRDKTVAAGVRISSLALLAPLFFNILALYLGFSVLFIQGFSGGTWFNARYGIMMMPTIAIFIGYLVHRAKELKYVVIGLVFLTTFFAFANGDAVTIDDARVGSSQKNVSEVSGWLRENVKNADGFVLISAASHDAIIFSSGLPMKKFIHEGTGTYWESATTSPDRWARWIIMRTNDDNDLTFRSVKKTTGFAKYDKVQSFPFADIYEIKPEYVSQLETKPVLPKQR